MKLISLKDVLEEMMRMKIAEIGLTSMPSFCCCEQYLSSNLQN
jgi:hypothetical protein